MTLAFPMIENVKRALVELRRQEPTCKTVLVKQVLPDIEESLAAGFTLKAIRERCREAGLATSYKDFCTYVHRARKDAVPSAATRGRKTDSNTSVNVAAVESPDFDPLANIRHLEANRPGFHWRGTQNIDVLVHGEKKDRPK